MESVDSSPNHHKPPMNGDYEGGSDCDCDDVISVTSSTCGSAVHGSYYAPKGNNGIKYRTNSNNKLLKNVRSFQRRAKSRTAQPSVHMSYHHESGPSQNYLKATSSSEGKKLSLSSSNGSVIDSSEQNSSHSSPSHKSFQNLSKTTTSSARNVGILLKKTSFKPKRSSLTYARVSEDVPVNRATYSSTLKDSKFPKPIELQSYEMELRKPPSMKICRYHHCSLHGHCHGTDDSVPPPKHFQYNKRRRSLKKQKSVIPKSDKMRNFKKSQMVPVSEPENCIDSNEDICAKPNDDRFGEGYVDFQDMGLFEIACGEMSYPERSYQETLSILKKHSGLEKQGFGEMGTSRLSGYCLKCSCSIREESTSPVGFSQDTRSFPIFEKEEKQVSTPVEENEAFDREGYDKEGFDKDFRETPVKFDEFAKNNISSSASDSQASSCNNSVVDEEFTADTPAGNYKGNLDMQVQDTEIQSPVPQGSKLQFRKPRHISMWNLIHQHMSSDLATDSIAKPLQSAYGENQEDNANQMPAKVSSDTDKGQEIEIRKLFAIKLVREAIEKILLPEVQDQASDDQSVTNESTPRSQVIEKNQTDHAFIEESNRESDAAKVEQAISDPKEESMTGDVGKTGKSDVSMWKKKAPKHWSNLKKWILLQRFIKELEKVKKFNLRKPQHLTLSPDPEAEKVSLRAQTVDGKKSAEEWMLDYALQQAVSQLAPTQKKKVALLVKAFESVVPSQEEPLIPFRIPSYKALESVSEEDGQNKVVPFSGKDKLAGLHSEIQESNTTTKLTGKSEDASGLDERHVEINVTLKSVVLSNEKSEETSCTTPCLILDGNGKLERSEKLLTSDSFGSQLEKIMDTEKQESKSTEENKPENTQLEKQNRIKMWHMIYQHVVSGIAEKVGSKILEASDDDEMEENKSKDNSTESHVLSEFTKNDAFKLVKEAVDEILLPENDSLYTESPTGEISPAQNKFEPQRSKNWSKLKKLVLLKRSIRALQIGTKPQPAKSRTFVPPQMNDPEPEKIDLRNQMIDERKKAEQWMLDYAVQHIVTKLTPARKTRVAMLVEAFEAVVPLPET